MFTHRVWAPPLAEAQCVMLGDVLEIHDGIISNFYQGLPHVYILTGKKWVSTVKCAQQQGAFCAFCTYKLAVAARKPALNNKYKQNVLNIEYGSSKWTPTSKSTRNVWLIASGMQSTTSNSHDTHWLSLQSIMSWLHQLKGVYLPKPLLTMVCQWSVQSGCNYLKSVMISCNHLEQTSFQDNLIHQKIYL